MSSHLLIADTPDAIAIACARVLEDESLRARLTDNAHRLFVERYQTERVHDEVRRIASTTVSLSSGASSAPG